MEKLSQSNKKHNKTNETVCRLQRNTRNKNRKQKNKTNEINRKSTKNLPFALQIKPKNGDFLPAKTEEETEEMKEDSTDSRRADYTKHILNGTKRDAMKEHEQRRDSGRGQSGVNK